MTLMTVLGLMSVGLVLPNRNLFDQPMTGIASCKSQSFDEMREFFRWR